MKDHSNDQDMSLAELLQGFSLQAVDPGLQVSGMTLDSRNVSAGDLFVAVQGVTGHGLQFADQAIRQGARAIVYDSDQGLVDQTTRSIPLIAVPSLSLRVAELASRFYGQPGQALRVIGITGTNGKTTCSVLLAQALQHIGTRAAVIGTLGSGTWGALDEATNTTPDAVSLQRRLASFRQQGIEQVVMEVSSHGLHQRRVLSSDFDVAVLTNLSQDHLDYHGDMEAYAEAKSRLFRAEKLSLAVINIDDGFGRQLLAEQLTARQVVSYGIGRGDVHITQLQQHAAGLRLQLASPWGVVALDSPLIGRFNAVNLLACAAVLLASGHAPSAVASALAAAHAPPGRMECFRSSSATIVVDYAHTPDALQQVLSALREHLAGRRLICVFGCGGERDQGKRPLMGAVAERLADSVVVTDDNPRREDAARIRKEIMAGMSAGKAVEIADRGAAIRYAWQQAGDGDIVLLAGKGHETSMQRGDLRLAFSDREVAARLTGSEA